MVTKHNQDRINSPSSLILAKIHMVTKLISFLTLAFRSLILAKIHMVTKLDIFLIFVR